MRRLASLALLGLLLLAPVALAQDDKEAPPACPDGHYQDADGSCSKQAWVDDCPPDRMCAADAPSGNETSDGNATYSGDCGGEVCAYQDPDEPASSDDGSTCMDGEARNEPCDDGVQYLDGGHGGDAVQADPISAPAEGSSEGVREVPGAGLALVLAALGVTLLALARRRA